MLAPLAVSGTVSLCFVTPGGHLGSSCGVSNADMGVVGAGWILVSELAVKHLQQLLVPGSFPGSGSIIYLIRKLRDCYSQLVEVIKLCYSS